MFKTPWNEKKQEIKPQKEEFRFKREFRVFVFSFIVNFIVVLATLIGRDFIKFGSQYWDDAGIPYSIKEEHLQFLNLNFIRFKILSHDDNGFLANWFQKRLYKLYFKIKEKIPDEDPFWLDFWCDASHSPIQDYNEKIKQELLTNLSLLVTNKSKVKDFNDYRKFRVARSILATIRYEINYYRIKELETKFRFEALNIILPMLEDLTRVKFVKGYKPYMNFHENTFYFANSVLASYSSLIKMHKQIACDQEFNYKIFYNLGIYKTIIGNDYNRRIFGDDAVKTIQGQYKEALDLYNNAYTELKCNY